MMPTIRIDDEVYAALQGEAKAFVDTPNTVLRRKFGLPSERGEVASAVQVTETTGKLAVLVENGLLNPAEKLVWHRSQQGKTHEALVMANGALLTEGNVRHNSPSGAARHLAGYEVNGWRCWRQESTGKTLEQLWDEYESTRTT